MNWDDFKNDSLYSSTLTYWYDEWESISKEIEDGTIGINFINIRVVLSDIINEYELNHFENDNNRKIYISLIETLLLKTHINIFREELLILKNKLEKKEKQEAYVISKELSSEISKKSFAYILFDELYSVLEKKLLNRADRIRLKELTKEIIIDLVTAGMSIEDVKTFVSAAFKSYDIFDENIYIYYKDIPKEIESDKEKRNYIDNLSIQNRLESFKNKLIPYHYEYIFIFPIWGMASFPTEESDNLILDCYIYNPEVEKIFEEGAIHDEHFNALYTADQNKKGASEDLYKNRSRCNAKILVSATYNESAKSIAETKYFNLLNLLNLNFAHEYREIYWDGQFIGKKVDETHGTFGPIFGNRDKKELRRNISKDRPTFLSSKKHTKLKEFSQIIDELKKRDFSYEANILISVINIMSQARWQSEENKLLNYWIAIESLANIAKKEKDTKFQFIKEAISNIYFLHEQYTPCHQLFFLVDFYSQSFFEKDETLHIPRDFLLSTGILDSHSTDSQVSLTNFFNRIEELKSFTTKDSFLDEIEDTIIFYKDNKVALKRLKEKKIEVKLTIDYIYKCRNQIVHNGYFDKNLIPYLTRFSEAYANSLLNRIIFVYSEGKFNLQNYFIKEIYEGDLLARKLTEKTHYNLGLKEWYL